MAQPGFFDLSERLHKLNEKDPLIQLTALIDWEDFRSVLKVMRPKASPRQALGPTTAY